MSADLLDPLRSRSMASGQRAQLPVLACVVAALSCARIASCFVRGDLVLCTWGGDSFSTTSLQLVVRLCLRKRRLPKTCALDLAELPHMAAWLGSSETNHVGLRLLKNGQRPSRSSQASEPSVLMHTRRCRV